MEEESCREWSGRVHRYHCRWGALGRLALHVVECALLQLSQVLGSVKSTPPTFSEGPTFPGLQH